MQHGADEYALDVRALMSNYRCIYGVGCQGTTPHDQLRLPEHRRAGGEARLRPVPPCGRLGIDPMHTRPMICHVEPAAAFLIADDLADGGRRVLVTLRPSWLGWFAPDGYWCTSDPAAYSANDPVFRRLASE